MRVLAQESWSWCLVEHDGRLLLSVLCGGVALHEVTVVLDDDQRLAWEREGVAALAPLVEAVRARPQAFAAR